MPEAITEQQARQTGEWPNIWYRSWPNGRDYSFTYVLVNASWRIYINNSPDYRNRPSGSVDTHRLDIGTRPYICWNQAINTLSEAQAVSALWADSTERYIATGRFQPPPGRPSPTDNSVLNGFGVPRFAAHPNRANLPWYQDAAFRLWGIGLVSLIVAGANWVSSMGASPNFWTFFWAGLATIGGVAAATYSSDVWRRVDGRDIIFNYDNWIIALAISGAFLGFATGADKAFTFLWLIVVLLAIANMAWYAIAVRKYENIR